MELTNPCVENPDLAQRLAGFMLAHSGAMQEPGDFESEELAGYLRTYEVAGPLGQQAANLLSRPTIPEPVLGCAARQTQKICPDACRKIIGDRFSSWNRPTDAVDSNI